MPRKRDLNREAQIQHLYEQGVRTTEIARKLNVSRPTVSRVVGPQPRKVVDCGDNDAGSR